MYLKLSFTLIPFLVSVSSEIYGFSANCGDPNTVTTDCASIRGRKCSDYNKNVQYTNFCIPFGCVCKEGLVYDENIAKCVNKEDCTPICSENEEISNCANGGCFGARKCSEIKNRTYTSVPVKCVKLRPESCVQACVCKKYYLRNDNGVCVPLEECELNEKCTQPNEFWDTCPKRCSSQSCKHIGLSLQCSVNPAYCKPSCRCAQNFYRNEAGICIPEDECPQKVHGECPQDEVWNECINDGNIPQKSCTSLILGPVSLKSTCLAGCQCRDDWFRTDEGVCVPQDKCPPNKCTGADEMWDDCMNSKCIGPFNCSQRNFVRHCEKIKDGSCKAGCRCKFDYCYNENGTCQEYR